MATAGESSARSLEKTPTWALAVVFFVIVFICIIIEHSIHLLTHWLKKRRKNALIDAVDKLKSELMLLGFMSLLLAVTQSFISNICIPTKVADIMLPCLKAVESESLDVKSFEHYGNKNINRNLLSMDGLYEYMVWQANRRRLDDDTEVEDDAAGAVSDSCTSKGKVSLISTDGILQLRIFICALVVMQIVYSVLTMALGRAKMRRWKTWEKETRTTEYLAANDPDRFRLTRQTTFGRRHVTSCTETSTQLWIKCFFRQFFRSVAKVDYLTLRHSFISAHMSSARYNHYFNFQKYIQRSLEEDFKVVVGISPLMWFVVVIFLLLDVHGWQKIFAATTYVPLLIVLLVGTKLETIVAKMALRINERTDVIKGTPLVEPSDKLFWFGRPRFVLILLHFTLFLNAFELAFFIWVSTQFGVDSCFHEHTAITVTGVVLAIIAQVLCSYITLPLYALVTQMGSQFRSRVLEEQTAKIIKQWHTEVRERKKKEEEYGLHSPPRISLSKEWSSKMGSPINEFSSLIQRLVSMPKESNNNNQLANKGKLVLVDEASSSRSPSPVVKREMLMLRRH
ncbi:MLO-like protein 3 [Pistacia vera]|uniref:MLO-like protein 3 n=1 Tax=Pistacia vera TaxID=55513 RepID=UPI00126390D6|nr:MLO-like protein 3 [Pistacia vera]